MKRILLAHLVLLIFISQLNAQWHWQNPTPIGKPIYDMQFIDSLNGFVCGYGGMVLKTTNGGVKWEELEVPTDGLIIKIFFLDKDIGWYLSYGDMSLFKTTDAGLHWSLVSSFSPKYATTIWFVNELEGFAGGYQSLLKTTDGGINWTEDSRIGSGYSIFFLDENVGYISSPNGINKTTDRGTTWTYIGIPSFNLTPSKIFAYDINNIYVIGTSYWITEDPSYLYYFTTDGGTSWTGKSFNQSVTDVYFKSPTNGFLCTGKILRTTNHGVSWDSTSFSGNQLEFQGNNSWAAGVNTLTFSNDQWNSSSSQIKGIFSGFLWDGCAKDTNIAFACGSNNTIIGTNDGGKNWSKYYSSNINRYLNGITIKDNEIWAVGEQGLLVYSKDNGNTWFEKNIAGKWLSDITFLSDGTGFIAGTADSTGAIFTSSNDGESWSIVQSFPEIWSIDKIKFSRDNLGWAIGYPETILRSTTGGFSWDVVEDTVFGVSSIAVCGDSVWVTHSNKVLRSTDAGNTWESFKVFDYNTIIFSNCDIDFINSKIGYISTYDSRVFKTTDGGETWKPENYPKGLNNFAMDFVNEEVGWVFGYPGIVLKREPTFVFVDDELNSIPKEFLLNQNYPNPFNNSSVIKYSIYRSSPVTIKIFNLLGEEIETLVNSEIPVGTYEITWKAENLPSGVYFYQLKAGDFIQTRKMILLK